MNKIQRAVAWIAHKAGLVVLTSSQVETIQRKAGDAWETRQHMHTKEIKGKCLGIGQSMDTVLNLIRNSNGGRTHP